MTLIVCLPSAKGGVGKTTTLFNLARAAQLRRLTTLVVDLSPQADMTRTLLDTEPSLTVADVLSARSDTALSRVITSTKWDEVDIVPAGDDLFAVATELLTMGTGRECRLRDGLDTQGETYELVLIDCPPVLDLLTTNGLTAAGHVLIVTTAEVFAQDGFARLRDAFNTVRRTTNPDLKISGIIANAVNYRTLREQYCMERLRPISVPVWGPPIRRATVIGEAIEAKKGLDEWSKSRTKEFVTIYDGYLSRLLTL